jgi:hypothetical protein
LILYVVHSNVKVLFSKLSMWSVLIFEYCLLVIHVARSRVSLLWSPFLYAFRFHLRALSSHFSIDPFSCGITVVFVSLCSPFSYTSVVSVSLCGPFSRTSMLSLCFSAPVYCCRVCSDVRIDSGLSCHHRPQCAHGYSLCTPFRSALLGLERPS